MRSYYKVYRGPVLTNPTGAQQFLFAHPTNGDEVVMEIKQFNKSRAIQAYNSLGFYSLWKAYDSNGTNLANFTGSQLANGLYTILPYWQHPLN